ncbi:MAG: hypothetical protein CBC13_02530 [Planctomycetia bacterium TMED53]|nr:MAG: hypothetical protein CBC13_02530 [Planctomycetia bacterium TMED53]
MTEERVILEEDPDLEHVSHLILNRPEKKNALDGEMIEALHNSLHQIEKMSHLRCLIVRGSGDSFVAGADVAALKARGTWEALQGVNQTLFRRLAELHCPTIAMIRGWTLGGGCELALACDLRIASETTQIGQPEVGLGIIPAAGGCHRLERVVGTAKAKELIFTGKIIDAEEAVSIGLVNVVAPDSEIETIAVDWAKKIAKNAPGAVQLAKKVMNGSQETGMYGRDLLESISQAICFESAEKHQRMQKFLDRKKK